jgi:hypothetical protein|tara:strand:+ start:7145 stop:7315 length:171 start_codon:yes stop_codon:yes gene_type:complete
MHLQTSEELPKGEAGTLERAIWNETRNLELAKRTRNRKEGKRAYWRLILLLSEAEK